MNEMTCREFDEIVHGYVRMELLRCAFARSGTGTYRAMQSLRRSHGGSHRPCGSTEASSRRVQYMQAPPHVESALLAEFRNHHRRASWRRAIEWSSIGAAAAVLLIVLWTMGIRAKGAPQAAPKKDVSSQSRVPLDAKAAAAAPAGDVVQAVAEKASDMPAISADGDETSGRHVCGFGLCPGALYWGHCFGRSGHGRACAADAGFAGATWLPRRRRSDDDLIQADVLVGEDGWPRGVKLVQ